MPYSQSLPWTDPLALAAAIDEPYWVLLYSGIQTTYSGRYSYLAHSLSEKIEGEDFSILKQKLSLDQRWFGYFGYGLKNKLENLPVDLPNWLSLPSLCMMRFRQVYRFDHEKKALTLYGDTPPPLPTAFSEEATLPPVTVLHSNMTRQSYLAKAAHIIERIHAGDLYQANLTRKFMGEFAEPPHAFSLFKKLCAASPAPYSAFLRLNDIYVISSSPELFVKIESDGQMHARPIKGTSPRFSDPIQDNASRNSLANSAKDQAENLMIVDLMRNDLSRVCIPGSIQVERLFEVTSHANVHHMSSTITGWKKNNISTLDAIAACFPPGSMTGAPKYAAIKLCSEMEELERGIYSGAIGLLGGDGSAELSVVIRTLLLKGNRFEFQVGGGIVADSTPEGELMELIDKARGICQCLGIKAEALEEL